MKINEILLGLDFYGFLLLSTAAVPVYILYHAIYQLYFSPLSKVPGPWYTAVSRFWLASKTMMGQRLQAVHELQNKYGPFVRIAPNEIAVSDLKSVKRIHSLSDPFPKSKFYVNLNGGIDSIFALIPNDEHKARRRIWGSAFSNTNLAMLEPVVKRHTLTCVAKIRRELDAGKKSDILQWYLFMATDILGEISFGRDFRMLATEKVNPMVEDLTAVTFIGGVRAEIPIFSYVQAILAYVPIPAVQWFIGSSKRLEEHSTRALANFRREVKDCKDRNGKPRPSLFTKMMDEMDDPTVKHKLTMQELRHEAVFSMIAGSDTITYTGSWIIWGIYRHPEVRRKLEEELKTMLPPDVEEFTDEKLQKLPYLKMVVKEGLRLYTAAQMGIPRAVPPGGRQFGDHLLPEGTNVTSQAHTMHLQPDIFEKPKEFYPERWMNPTKSMETAYMPFGGQSRICLGQNLAMMELRYLVSTMIMGLPDAELAKSCTDKSMEIVSYFLAKPRAGKCEIQKKND